MANAAVAPRKLSPRERLAFTVGMYLAMSLFVVAVACLIIVADVDDTSYLSHTRLGARVRPLLQSKPFVVGGFFNIGAFGAVLSYSKLHEHQRALEEERARKDSAPKSRQERRKAVSDRSKQLSKTRRQAEDAMRTVGARVFVEKGRKQL